MLDHPARLRRRRHHRRRTPAAPPRDRRRGDFVTATSTCTGASFQPMPALTTEEYDALKTDIAARGVLVPVVVDQHGRLLDGHHRRQAAIELGIDCPAEVRPVTS